MPETLRGEFEGREVMEYNVLTSFRVLRNPISDEGEKVVILRVITSSLVTNPAISAVSGAIPLGDCEI